jgi:prolyl oligopeptidase
MLELNTRFPYSPIEPVWEILHGVEFMDPYRWLEDRHSLKTGNWLREQNRYFRAYLDKIPEIRAIRRRVAELLDVETIESPKKVGNRYFYLKRTAGQNQPCIYMREGINGDEHLLIDPNFDPAGPFTAVKIHAVSADGNLLAYELRQGGERTCEIGFFDVRRGELLRDRLPRGRPRGLVFAPDSRGFYYAHDALDTKHRNHRAVLQHVFGTGLEQDREIFATGDDPRTKLVLSGDSIRLCFVKVSLKDKITTDYYLWNVATRGPARRVETHSEHLFALNTFDGRVFAITDNDAPNLRILELMNPEEEHPKWREVVPTSRLRIKAFVVRNHKVLVRYEQNASVLIVVSDLDGKKIDQMAFSENESVEIDLPTSDGEQLFYQTQSFTKPPSIFGRSLESGQTLAWSKKRVPFNSEELSTIRVSFRSKDGTSIPMSLVGNKSLLAKGPQPLILTGYGGFGISMTPQFGIFTSFMMEKGCIFALANLRGGGEFGVEWHGAGKRRNRQNAFDDFLAAATWLIENGYTNHDQLGIFGGSNSGLLVGAAITQRPELFRAALCMGPLLDMLRYHLFGSASRWKEEYGSPEDINDFNALRAYSPYHRVKEGVPYPALMIISGDADTRCDPMHARKMTARLQAATSSDHPILLDYKTMRGHTPVLPLCERIDGLTDRIAFMCDQLGVAV